MKVDHHVDDAVGTVLIAVGDEEFPVGDREGELAAGGRGKLSGGARSNDRRGEEYEKGEKIATPQAWDAV
jgi:hypothetical protein